MKATRGHNEVSAFEEQQHRMRRTWWTSEEANACILPIVQLVHGHHCSHPNMQTVSPSPRHGNPASSPPPPKPPTRAMRRGPRRHRARYASRAGRATNAPTCATRFIGSSTRSTGKRRGTTRSHRAFPFKTCPGFSGARFLASRPPRPRHGRPREHPTASIPVPSMADMEIREPFMFGGPLKKAPRT